MKTTKFKILFYLVSIGLFLSFSESIAQDEERITPPKKHSKVKSIDDFSNQTFEIYNTIFVYDSLTEAGVEIPVEIEDEIAANIETRVDSLYTIIPDMLDDVDSAPIMRKLRAAGSLNKSRKAITFMLQTMKKYTLGEPENKNEIVENR
jgi:hypothetical protein